VPDERTRVLVVFADEFKALPQACKPREEVLPNGVEAISTRARSRGPRYQNTGKSTNNTMAASTHTMPQQYEVSSQQSSAGSSGSVS